MKLSQEYFEPDGPRLSDDLRIYEYMTENGQRLVIIKPVSYRKMSLQGVNCQVASSLENGLVAVSEYTNVDLVALSVQQYVDENSEPVMIYTFEDDFATYEQLEASGYILDPHGYNKTRRKNAFYKTIHRSVLG